MLVEIRHGWLLTVHGTKTPAAEDWQRYVATLDQWRANPRGQLVYTLGGMPSSVQRSASIDLGKQLVRERKARGEPMPLTAVMTDSTAVRALATLFNWFFDNSFQAFALTDWTGAFAHLKIEPDQQTALRTIVKGLASRVE